MIVTAKQNNYKRWIEQKVARWPWAEKGTLPKREEDRSISAEEFDNKLQNSCILIKMASGGLMCEVSAVPKIGHKIDSVEIFESLGKFIMCPRSRESKIWAFGNDESSIFQRNEKPKLCWLFLSCARTPFFSHRESSNFSRKRFSVAFKGFQIKQLQDVRHFKQTRRIKNGFLAQR